MSGVVSVSVTAICKVTCDGHTSVRRSRAPFPTPESSACVYPLVPLRFIARELKILCSPATVLEIIRVMSFEHEAREECG